MAEHDCQDPIYCQLCGHQSGDGHRTFLCLACASADVYEARFHNAQNILQKEALGREISGAANDARSLTAGSQTVVRDASDAARRLAYDELRSARAEAKLQTREYDQTIQEMEEECQDLREEVRRRKDDMRMRKEKIRTAGKASRQHKQYQPSDDDFADRLEAISLASAKIESRADPQQKKLADARAYMVREAATLWGLTVKRKRGRDGKIRELAYMAGLPVPDLRDLLSARPEHLNASVVAIVYMLNQTCSYLGLKLPSQPLLPDQEHAYPRILPVHSSYAEEEISSTKSQLASPKAGHQSHDSHGVTPDNTTEKLSGTETHSPRARALYLKQPLLKLYSEDTLAYESYVEAMSLLAWDVAWLAKIQGIDVGSSRRHGYSWEGVCDLGRNLWILFGPQQQQQQHSSQGTNAGSNANGTTTDGETRDAAARIEDDQLTRLGTFSHGTNRNNAAGPESAMLGLNAWRLGNPNTVIRRLKESLADRKMAGEWELLEEEEWDQTGVAMARQGSSASAAAATSSLHQQTGGGPLEKAAKGWQKLRPRNSGE